MTDNPAGYAVQQESSRLPKKSSGRVILLACGLTLTAQLDSHEFDESLGLPSLKTLDLSWGAAVNIGREKLLITALRNSA